MARGGMFAMASKMFTYPLGLLLAIVLTRVLTPAELGGYFLAMSLVIVIATLIQFGAGPVMVKFVAAALARGDEGRARQVLRYGFTWVLLLSLATMTALHTPFGSWLLNLLKDADVLRGSLTMIALLAVAYASISFICEVLRSFSDLGSASLFAEQMLQRFLLLAVLLAALVLDTDLDLLKVLLLMVAVSLATTLLGLVFVLVKYRRLDHSAGTRVTRRELLRQAPPFFFMRLNFWLMDTAPVWVLGMFHAPEVVALYGVANMLALIVLAPWTVANTSLGPAIVKLHTEERQRDLRSVLGAVGGIATACGAAIVFTLIAFGKPLLAIVFTEALTPAYATMVILAIGRGISIIFGAPAMLLSMTHHQVDVLRVLLISSGIGFAAYFVAARFGGIEWVAFVGAVLVIAQALVLTYISRRLLNISTVSTFHPRDWGKIARQVLNRS